MHRIVYLHGLASSSLSSTPKQLQKLYPEFEDGDERFFCIKPIG